MKSKQFGWIPFALALATAGGVNASDTAIGAVAATETPSPAIYYVWYGCWEICHRRYADSSGNAPTGGMSFADGPVDRYSHGAALTEADVADIVANQLATGGLRADPSAIYVVLATSDVSVTDATQSSADCCNLRGLSVWNGCEFRYAFAGNPARCSGGCGADLGDARAWYGRHSLQRAEKCEGTYGPM